MTDINSQNIEQEEEISLIDLFAVLLRYRKMIVLGTIIMTFIASIFIVVIPKLKDMTKVDKVSVIYSIKVNRMPGSFRGRVFEGSSVSDVGSYLTSNIQYLPFLADEYKKFPFFEKDGKLPENQTTDQFNQMVSEFIDKKSFENSKIKVSSSVIVDTYDLQFEIVPSNKEIADNFAKDVVRKVDANLIDIIMPRVDFVKTDLENSLVNLKSTFETMNDAGAYRDIERCLQDIEKFKREFDNNPHFATLISEQPFSYTVKKMSKTKGLGIAMFASLFLMVFIAFARNAIQNIKNDPVALQTIRNAMQGK